MKPWRGLATALLLALPGCSQAQPTDPRSPLVLERTIPLPDTKGRIDHLAVDLTDHRLFVAEIANGTVDEVDLEAGKVIGRIAGLGEPQGVAWLPSERQLVVACGDGSVRFYDADRRELARIELGDDADNVRVDPRNGHVIVGYGKGALATIDPVRHTVLVRLALPGHPEGFRLFGSRAYINIPDDGSVVAADIDQGRQLVRWPTGLHRLNFPLAVEPSGKRIVIAYRLPAALATIDTKSGQTLSLGSACGDADDLFLAYDHILLVCGAGHVDVIGANGGSARVQTSGGARTGLYVPELDRLFVAVPARGRPAAIWALKPNFPGNQH
ncbi:YncE family protein [Sphingomonas sp. YL-JM2C]